MIKFVIFEHNIQRYGTQIFTIAKSNHYTIGTVIQ